MKYVKAKGDPPGKRAKEIHGIIEQLVDAEEPVPWTELTSNVGINESARRASMLLAAHALELVGAVERYTYNDGDGTRTRNAYALSPSVKVTK